MSHFSTSTDLYFVSRFSATLLYRYEIVNPTANWRGKIEWGNYYCEEFFSDLVKLLGFTQSLKVGTGVIVKVKVRPGLISTTSPNQCAEVCHVQRYYSCFNPPSSRLPLGKRNRFFFPLYCCEWYVMLGERYSGMVTLQWLVTCGVQRLVDSWGQPLWSSLVGCIIAPPIGAFEY